MANIFGQLQQFLNKLSTVFTSTKQTTSTVKPVMDEKAQQASTQLNRGYSIFQGVTGSASVLPKREEQPKQRFTPPPAQSIFSRETKPFYTYPNVTYPQQSGQTSQQRRSQIMPDRVVPVEEEKPEVYLQASPATRMMPDRLLQEKQTISQQAVANLTGSKKTEFGNYMNFSLQPNAPVYVDADQRGALVFTSDPKPFQLFMTNKNQFYVLPVKDDGSLDVVASKIQLMKDNMKPDEIDRLLSSVAPVKAFSGIVEVLTGDINALTKETPLTLGNLEDGGEVYFNPVTNEFTSEWTPYRVAVNPNVLPDTGAPPFSIVSSLDQEAVPVIVDEDTRKVLNNFVSSAYQASQTLKYIGNINETGQVSGQRAFDPNLVLKAYSPFDIEQGEKEVQTVDIFRNPEQIASYLKDPTRENLQPIEIRTRMRKETKFGVIAEALWQGIIYSGDEPERALRATPFTAGSRPVNIFQTISDRFGVALRGFFSNFPVMFNQAFKAINERMLETWKSNLGVTQLLGWRAGEEFIRGQIAKAERNIETYQLAIDKIVADNNYAKVAQAIRLERSLNNQIAYNQIIDYMASVAQQVGDLKDVKVERDWKGDGFIVFADGRREPLDKFLNSFPSYKEFAKEYGEASAKRLFNLVLSYPDTMTAIVNANALRNDLLSKQNFIYDQTNLVVDWKVQRALKTANFVNAFSNLDMLTSAMRSLADGRVIATQSSVINTLIQNSAVYGDGVTKEEVDFILEVLNSRYNDLIIADVSDRLANLPNPSFSDMYLIMRDIYPFYFLLDNIQLAEERNLGSQAYGVSYIPEGRSATTWQEYLEEVRKVTQDNFVSLKSFTSNLISTSQKLHDAGEYQRANAFFQDALAFLEGSMQYDRLTRRVVTNQDIFASYAWDVRPDAYFLFLKNVALAEAQLRRPLTPTEISDIRDNTVPLEFIIAGQMVFDFLNVLDLVGGIGVGVDLLKGIGRMTKITTNVIEPAVEFAKKTKLVRFFTDLSIRSKVQKSAYQIGDFFIRVMGDNLYARIDDTATGAYKITSIIEEAVYALNRARQMMAEGVIQQSDFLDEAVSILRQSTISQQTLPSYVSSASLKRFLNAVDVFVKSSADDDIDVIAKRISTTLQKSIDKSLSQFDEEVNTYIKKNFNKWFDKLEASARLDLSKRLGVPVSKISDDLVTDEILSRLLITRGEDIDIEIALKEVFKSEALSNVSKTRSFVHFIFSTSDEFIRLGRNLNRAWLGTNLLADSFLGTIGRKFPIAQPVVRLLGNAYDLFMGMWVMATLARRPAWVVFNQMENLFRFITLSIFNPSEYKQMIFGLIPDASRDKILQELGVIPSEIGIDFLPVQTITDDNRFLKIFAGRSIASLSENPFKWLTSHYFSNIKEIWSRGGFFNRLFSPYSAFVTSVQSFNQVIEYGMRLRVYNTILKRNLRRVMPSLITILSSEMQKAIEDNVETLRVYLSDIINLTDEDLEHAIRTYIRISSAYVEEILNQVVENLSDPFRALNLMARNSTDRFIGVLGILNPELYQQIRSIGAKSNLQEILNLVSSRLSDTLLRLADEGLEPKITEDLVLWVIDEIKNDLDSAYGTAVNLKVRYALREAIYEADALGRVVPPTDADDVDEVIDITEFTQRPPRPEVAFAQRIDETPSSFKRTSKGNLDDSIKRVEASIEQAKETSNKNFFSRLKNIFKRESAEPSVPVERKPVTRIIETAPAEPRPAETITGRIVDDAVEPPPVRAELVDEPVSEVHSAPVVENITPENVESTVRATPDPDLTSASSEDVAKVKEIKKRQANAKLNRENKERKKKGEEILRTVITAELTGQEVTNVASQLPASSLEALSEIYTKNINQAISKTYSSILQERYGVKSFDKLSPSQKKEFVSDLIEVRKKVLFERVLNFSPTSPNVGRVDIAGSINQGFLPIMDLQTLDFMFIDGFLNVLNKNALEYVFKSLYPDQFKIAMLDVRGLHMTNNLTIERAGRKVLGGYEIGDAYLRHVVDIISENGLTVYRQGGDEFVILFPKSMSEEEMRAILDKISDEISARSVFVKGKGKKGEITLEFTGAKVNYGIGDTFSEASEAQKRAKDEFFKATGLDRNTYHLQLKTKGYKVIGVPDQPNKEVVDRQVEELRKQYNELHRKVTKMQEEMEVLRNSNQESPKLNELVEINKAILEQLSNLTKLANEGKIVILSGEVTSDGSVIRVVTNSADEAVSQTDKVVEEAEATVKARKPRKTKTKTTETAEEETYAVPTTRRKSVLFTVTRPIEESVHNTLAVAFKAEDLDAYRWVLNNLMTASTDNYLLRDFIPSLDNYLNQIDVLLAKQVVDDVDVFSKIGFITFLHDEFFPFLRRQEGLSEEVLSKLDEVSKKLDEVSAQLSVDDFNYLARIYDPTNFKARLLTAIQERLSNGDISYHHSGKLVDFLYKLRFGTSLDEIFDENIANFIFEKLMEKGETLAMYLGKDGEIDFLSIFRDYLADFIVDIVKSNESVYREYVLESVEIFLRRFEFLKEGSDISRFIEQTRILDILTSSFDEVKADLYQRLGIKFYDTPEYGMVFTELGLRDVLRGVIRSKITDPNSSLVKRFGEDVANKVADAFDADFDNWFRGALYGTHKTFTTAEGEKGVKTGASLFLRASDADETGVRRLFLSPYNGFNHVLKRVEGTVNTYLDNLIATISESADIGKGVDDFVKSNDFQKIAITVAIDEQEVDGVFVLKSVVQPKKGKKKFVKEYIRITPQEIYDFAVENKVGGFLGGEVGRRISKAKISRKLMATGEISEDLDEIIVEVSNLTSAQQYVEDSLELMRRGELEDRTLVWIDDEEISVTTKSAQEIESESLIDEVSASLSDEVELEEDLQEEIDKARKTQTKGKKKEQTADEEVTTEPEKTEITTAVSTQTEQTTQEAVRNLEVTAEQAFQRVKEIADAVSDKAISDAVISRTMTTFGSQVDHTFEVAFEELVKAGTAETVTDLVLNELIIRKYISPQIVRMIIDKDGTINKRAFIALTNKMLKLSFEQTDNNFYRALKTMFYYLAYTANERGLKLDVALENIGLIRKIENDARLKFIDMMYKLNDKFITGVKLFNKKELASQFNLARLNIFDSKFFYNPQEWMEFRRAWDEVILSLTRRYTSANEAMFIQNLFSQNNFSKFIAEKIQARLGSSYSVEDVVKVIQSILSEDLTEWFAEYTKKYTTSFLSMDVVENASALLGITVKKYFAKLEHDFTNLQPRIYNYIQSLAGGEVKSGTKLTPELEDLVAKISQWNTDTITHYQIYMNGSADVQALVKAEYARRFGNDFDVEDVEGIAESVRAVMEEVRRAKDFNDFAYKEILTSRYAREGIKKFLPDEFAEAVKSAVAKLSSGEDVNSVIASLKSRLYSQATGTGISNEVNRLYSQAIDNNMRLIHGIIQQKEQLITKARLMVDNPEQYSILASSVTLLDELISNYTSNLTFFADRAKDVFPASVLIKNNPDFAYKDGIGRVLRKLYNKQGESINRLAWEDYFLRMTELNRKYNQRFRTVLDLGERLNAGIDNFEANADVIMDRLVRAVDSADLTVRQFFDDFGIELNVVQSRTGTSVKVNQVVFNIRNPQDGSKFTLRPVGDTLEMTHLHSYMMSQLFSGMNNDEVARLLDQPISEYFKALRVAPDEPVQAVEEVTIAPIKSISELLSINFDESNFADEATKQLYKQLHFAVSQFINKNTASDPAKLKENLKVIIDTLATLYKIPTVVGDGVTSYNIFVKQLKETLTLLASTERKPIYQEVLNLLSAGRINSMSDLQKAFDSFIGEGSTTSKRYGLVEVLIHALNTWFAGTLNLPFAELASFNGGMELASAMRSKLRTLFIHSFGMTNKQADEAMKFAETILYRLARLNSSNLDATSAQEMAVKMWMTIFNGIYYSNRGSNALVSLSGLPQRNFLSGDLRFYTILSTEIQELLTKIGVVDDNAVLSEKQLEVLRKIIENIRQTGRVRIKDGERINEINFVSNDFPLEQIRQSIEETFGFLLRGEPRTIQVGDQTITSSLQITKGDFVSRINGKLFTINPSVRNNQYMIAIKKPIDNTGKSETLFKFKVDFVAEPVEGSDELKFIAKVDIGDGEIGKYVSVKRELERFFASNGFTHIQYKNASLVTLPSEPLSTLFTTSGSIYAKTGFIDDAGKAIKAVITVFNNANASTFFHEFYHAVEEFMPVTARYMINSEAFESVSKMLLNTDIIKDPSRRAVKEFLQKNADKIKSFDDLMTFVEKSTDGVPEEVITLMSMMKEYTVSVFEGYILNNLVTPKAKNLVTEGFIKEFKDILTVSYAKFRSKLVKARGNRQLFRILDAVLNFEDASRLNLPSISKYTKTLKEADLKVLERRLDNFRRAVYVNQNREISQTLYQRIEPIVDSAMKFKAWGLNNPVEFRNLNGDTFDYLLYTGRLFNSSLMDTFLPSEVRLTSDTAHAVFMDYAVSSLPPNFISMTGAEFRQAYEKMSARKKSLVDYLLYMFHTPDARFFDSNTLSYRVEDVFREFENLDFFTEAFEKMKTSVAYAVYNTIPYTPDRFAELRKYVSRFLTAVPSSTDIKKFERMPQFRKVVNELKTDFTYKFGEEFSTPNEVFDWVRRYSEVEGNIFQRINQFIRELYNPNIDEFTYQSKAWQAEVYLDYLPESLRESVRKGNKMYFVREDMPVYEIGKDGYLRQAGFSNLADGIGNIDVVSKARFAPFIYVGGGKRTLEFTLPNSSVLGKIEDLPSLVTELVAHGFDSLDYNVRINLGRDWMAMDVLPIEKLQFLVKNYQNLVDRLMNEIPQQWMELDNDTKLFQRVLKNIDKSKKPEDYATLYRALQKKLFKGLEQTNFTQTRMGEILESIGRGWWNSLVGAIFEGITPDESFKLLRTALINEMLGMESSDAILQAVRDWNFAKLMTKKYDGIFIRFGDTGERILISFNPDNIVSLNEIFTRNVPSEVSDYIKNIDTIDELIKTDFDIYHEFDGYKDGLVLKKGILPVLARDERYDSIYIVNAGILKETDPVIIHEAETSLRIFFRRFAQKDAHIVRYSDSSYIIFGKSSPDLDRLMVEMDEYYQKRVFMNVERTKRLPSHVQLRKIDRNELLRKAEVREGINYSIPFVGKARTMDVYPENGMITVGDIDYIPVARVKDPTGFKVRQLFASDDLNHPTWMIPLQSTGKEITVYSPSIPAVLEALGLSEYNQVVEETRKAILRSLSYENPSEAISRAIANVYLNFDKIGEKGYISKEETARLLSLWNNLRFLPDADRREFVDYFLISCLAEMSGVRRIKLAGKGSYYFVSVKDLYELPANLSKEFKPAIEVADELTNVLDYYTSVLDTATDLDGLMRAKLVADTASQVNGTSKLMPRKWFELYQSTDPEMAGNIESFSAFVKAPIFPVVKDGTEVLVSLEEILTFALPNNVLYSSPELFNRTMGLVIEKLSQDTSTDYSDYIRLFEWLRGAVDTFLTQGDLSTIGKFEFTPSPAFNLVFDYNVMKYVSDNLYSASSHIEALNGLKIFEDTILKALTQNSALFEFEKLLNRPMYRLSANPLLATMNEKISSALYDAWDLVNQGGKATILGKEFEVERGAISEMNRIMIDYFGTTRADEWMKMIMPFWMYPSRSLPYWLDLVGRHPEIIAFYAKYKEWSDNINWQDGAVTTTGEILPSLKGYLPLGVGIYFNPLAPFLFRFVVPEIKDLPETRPESEMGIFQKVARLFLDIIPQYGFAVNPLVQSIMMNFYDPYYPKPSLMYELVRSLVPIEWMPPILERYIISKLRQVSHIDMPEVWKPEVSWMDYLIEQEILSTALARINSTTSQEEKQRIAKWAHDLITDPNRQENPDWQNFEDSVRTSDYFRYMVGNFTGIYAKTFSPARADLLVLRNQVNGLKQAINDVAKANIFGLYATPTEIYNLYNQTRFNTPEGQIYQLYQMTRYIIDPQTGQFARGAERERLLIENAKAENATQMYYKAIEEENQRYMRELALIPIGDTESRRKLKEEHFENLLKIRTDPIYANARRTRYFGVKPEAVLRDEIYKDWWFALTSLEPKFNEYDTYEAYMEAREKWLEQINEDAQILLPVFKVNMLVKAQEENASPERIKLIMNLIDEVVRNTNAQEYENFKDSGKMVYDAIWDAYQATYVSKFYDAVKDKKKYERDLAEKEFLLKYPKPNEDEIVKWIKARFGDKFSEAEIRSILSNNKPLTISQREDLRLSQIEKDAQALLKRLFNAGNRSSELFKNFLRTYVLLGGYESDIDLVFANGADPQKFGDPQKFYTIYDRMMRAFEIAGVPKELTIPELKERIEVERINDAFKEAVLRELGEDYYNLMTFYYTLSEKEQAQFRKQYPDQYAKIKKYYQMRDEFSQIYPIWAKYYNPNYDPEKKSSFTFVSDGKGYYRSTSSRSALKSVREVLPFLHMGKRSTMDATRLFLDNVLGKGGAEKRPVLTKELKELIGEVASSEIETGRADEETIKYLNKLAKINPSKSDELKKLASQIRKTRGGDLTMKRQVEDFQ